MQITKQKIVEWVVFGWESARDCEARERMPETEPWHKDLQDRDTFSIEFELDVLGLNPTNTDAEWDAAREAYNAACSTGWNAWVTSLCHDKLTEIVAAILEG